MCQPKLVAPAVRSGTPPTAEDLDPWWQASIETAQALGSELSSRRGMRESGRTPPVRLPAPSGGPQPVIAPGQAHYATG